MTKEEATTYIKEWLKDECIDCKDREALTLAVEALEQEPKSGQWKANMRFGMYPCDEMWICSECREQSMKRSDYCPNCGAKMEESEDKE